ncbi:MAG: M23 family metallopeptidase [Gemmatimonadaceae bacterium]
MADPPTAISRRASPAARVARSAASALLLLLGHARCQRADEIRERLEPPTAYERYVRGLQRAGLDSTALGREWVAAGAQALRTPATLELPYSEAAYFAADRAGAEGYRFAVRRGQRIVVTLEAQAGSATRIFLDLFQAPVDTLRRPEHVRSDEGATRRLDAEADRDGTWILRVQPELLRSVRYTVTLRAEASLAFPVSGRDSRAIQSRFGADRDAGRRRHQGVDIFAPRGTPAIAAVDGRVTWVGTNALGGNVVFLRDDARRQNLYYAHLDTQLVRTGTRVRVGDTLGLVGNTGNARTTPPHLHFGIYHRGEGAVDPYAFVYSPARPAPAPRPDSVRLGSWSRTSGPRVVELRASPDVRAALVASLPRQTPVRVVAETGRWYRVELPDGERGYLVAAATEPAGSPLRRERTGAPTVLRDQPAVAATVVDSVGAGTSVAVYGRFGTFLFVRTPRGAMGWVQRG